MNSACVPEPDRPFHPIVAPVGHTLILGRASSWQGSIGAYFAKKFSDAGGLIYYKDLSCDGSFTAAHSRNADVTKMLLRESCACLTTANWGLEEPDSFDEFTARCIWCCKALALPVVTLKMIRVRPLVSSDGTAGKLYYSSLKGRGD